VIVLEADQDGVVDDAPVLVGDEGVLALPDGAFMNVARCEHVGESEGVRPSDLDLTLGAPDVPQRHALEQLPVLLDRIPVVAGVVMVVVDAVELDAVPARRVVVRRLLDPRVQEDPRVRVHLVSHGCYVLSSLRR
jgi:hypothetical protein